MKLRRPDPCASASLAPRTTACAAWAAASLRGPPRPSDVRRSRRSSPPRCFFPAAPPARASRRRPAASAESEASDQLRERAAVALETGRAAQAKQLYGSILARRARRPGGPGGPGRGGGSPGRLWRRARAQPQGGRAGRRAPRSQSARAAQCRGRAAADRTGSRGRAGARDGRRAGPDLLARLECAWPARDARQAWDEARTAYERALALTTDQGPVLNNLGMSRLSAEGPRWRRRAVRARARGKPRSRRRRDQSPSGSGAGRPLRGGGRGRRR